MKKNIFIDSISKLSSIPRFVGSPLSQYQSGADHAFRVAMIALQIVDEYNLKHKKKISREEILMKALLHDVEESVIGDIPTPVKYMTPGIREAFKLVEEKAMKETVLKDRGKNKREYYNYWKSAKKGKSGEIIKIADKMEALIKINFELNQGNRALMDAYKQTMDWFQKNHVLLSKYPTAISILNDYTLKE